MSQFREGNVVAFVANVDLSAKQFFIVKMHATVDNNIILAAAAADLMIGVLQNEPLATEGANVRILNASGTGKVSAGGTIAKDDKLTTDANGQAVATVTSTDRVFGIALEAAATNEIFEYLCVDEEVA